MTQMTKEEILSNPDSPEAETAVERMSPDERAELESQQSAASPPAEQDADTPAAAGEPSESEPESAKPEDDLSDIPESIKRTLEARPEDAENWRSLRGIAKDARKAAKEAADGMATLTAEKARLEAELAAMRAAQSAQVAPQPQAPALPDPNIDPGAYAQALVAQEVAQVRQDMRSQQLDAFEAQAVRTHGKEVVDGAFVWFQAQAAADPALAAQMNAAIDPWDFIVREKGRRETLASMGDDPAAYVEQVRREAREAALAEAQARSGQATVEEVERRVAERLPRSLAKVPGAGGQAVSDGYAGPTPMSQIVPGINSGG